jgi:hypothetical protein
MLRHRFDGLLHRRMMGLFALAYLLFSFSGCFVKRDHPHDEIYCGGSCPSGTRCENGVCLSFYDGDAGPFDLPSDSTRDVPALDTTSDVADAKIDAPPILPDASIDGQKDIPQLDVSKIMDSSVDGFIDIGLQPDSTVDASSDAIDSGPCGKSVLVAANVVGGDAKTLALSLAADDTPFISYIDGPTEGVHHVWRNSLGSWNDVEADATPATTLSTAMDASNRLHLALSTKVGGYVHTNFMQYDPVSPWLGVSEQVQGGNGSNFLSAGSVALVSSGGNTALTAHGNHLADGTIQYSGHLVNWNVLMTPKYAVEWASMDKVISLIGVNSAAAGSTQMTAAYDNNAGLLRLYSRDLQAGGPTKETSFAANSYVWAAGIAVDSLGRAHVAHVPTGGVMEGPLYYHLWDGQTANAPVLVTGSSLGAMTDVSPLAVSLAVDAQNLPHFAYTASGQLYWGRLDATSTWSVVPLGLGYPATTQIALTQSGQVHFAYIKWGAGAPAVYWRCELVQ